MRPDWHSKLKLKWINHYQQMRRWSRRSRGGSIANAFQSRLAAGCICWRCASVQEVYIPDKENFPRVRTWLPRVSLENGAYGENGVVSNMHVWWCWHFFNITSSPHNIDIKNDNIETNERMHTKLEDIRAGHRELSSSTQKVKVWKL
jgi:hypothetical protein